MVDPGGITTSRVVIGTPAFMPPVGRLLSTLVDEPRTDDVPLARVWDTATGRLVRTMTLPVVYADARVAVSPEGRFFIAANALGASSVCSVSAGKQVGQLGADAPVQGVAFHPGGRTLATLDEEGAVHIFDVAGLTSCRRRSPSYARQVQLPRTGPRNRTIPSMRGTSSRRV